MKELFDGFLWHSSIGIDHTLSGDKKFVTRLPNTRKAMMSFVASGDSSLLIHKATQALWRISEDGKFLEPVFDADVLTDEDLGKGAKQ